MGDYIEIGVRWIFALQMIFWGLNGFFQWVKTPPASKVIDDFVNACIQTKFLMPFVKIMEVGCGLFLLLGFMIPASLAAFAPLMFVITGLHIFHNPKPWGILLSFTLPYLILVFFYGSSLLRLVH